MSHIPREDRHPTPMTHDRPSFWSVIPAGGSGTRLWPLSRSSRPKFLLPLVDQQRSLIQQTVDRLRTVSPPERMLVVCGPSHAAPVARQLPEISTDQILVEPCPRGSGPAIALAAALIARKDPAAIMGSFAADHDVRDTEAFTSAVRIAMEIAEEGWLVTIGLRPTRPETGYGYIERTDHCLLTGAYRAACFVEKPDLERAKSYLASGRFLWNASMFIWSVSAFLAEFQRLLPDVHAGVMRVVDAWDTPRREDVIGEVWSGFSEVTIDNGVMERSPRVAVVPAEMGWSDVGDWHGLGTLLAQDELGNSVRADVINTGCANSVIWSETARVISLVGLDNVIVVDTPDALLVADRSRAQEVRSTVARLKQLNRAAWV